MDMAMRRSPRLTLRDVTAGILGATIIAVVAVVAGCGPWRYQAIHPVWWIIVCGAATSQVIGTICVVRELRGKYIHDLHIAALSRGASIGSREVCDLANRRPTARMLLLAFVHALLPTTILWSPVCCAWGVAWAIRSDSVLLAILSGAAMGGSIWILVAIMRMLIRQDRAQSARVNAIFGHGAYESSSAAQRYGMCQLVDQLGDLLQKAEAINGNHGDAKFSSSARPAIGDADSSDATASARLGALGDLP